MADDYRERDPLLRLLPEEPPAGFVAAGPDEQAWRGRAFLAVYGMGYPEAYSWWQALQTDPDHVEWMRGFVGRTPDTAIAEAVTRRQGDEAEPGEVAPSASTEQHTVP